MSARGLGVERLLERLGHHDAFELPETSGRRRGRRKAFVWHFKNAYAARRLGPFGAVHREELSSALASLSDERGARAQALRGRLLRLLGDPSGARRELEASWARAPSARAAGWLGEILLFGAPARALELFDRALTLDPDWPWPRLWKAAALLSSERLGPARRELARFAAPPGPRPFVHAMLSFQLGMQARDHRRALASARAAIRLDPASPAGYDAAGKALRRLGLGAAALAKFHDARERDLDVMGAYVFPGLDLEKTWTAPGPYLEKLNAAIARNPRAGALYAERAELKRDPRLCRYEEALEDYAAAARLEPRRGWLRAVLARAKNNLRGGGAGLEDFDAAVRLAPASGWIAAWRGALRARLGETAGALADFERASALMPWYPFTYAWRGALFNRLGRFAAARRDLDRALRLDPRYAFSFHERFLARRGLKDYAGAVRDLNRAFASDPKYAWLGEGLAPPARRAALRELDAAIKRLPREAWLHAWKGWCLLESGRPKEALASLDRAAALETSSGLVFAWRGRARRDLGRLSSAMADLTRAVRLSPGLWAAHQIRAEIQERRGRLRDALASLRVVVRLAPTTVPYLLAKASLALRLKRRREAFRDLDRAMQLAPGLFAREERRAVAGFIGRARVV